MKTCFLALWLAPLAIATSLAQTAPESAPAAPASSLLEPVQLEAVVVTSTRESLISAIELKRERFEIVDSIVASDIAKLPDHNVTDALQRITGVQILRDRGEGAGIAIRGLTQMETTLNGREMFTAGLSSTGNASRVVDFADLPAEIIASLNVYKTASADHIEGGIGGLINIVTRRPFDFSGRTTVGSLRFIHGDLARKTKPQFSALVSDRLKLRGGGEVGALVNVVYQERAWREDQKGTGPPTARSDVVPGRMITVQSSTSESTVFGTRVRTGINGIVQWRPSETLQVYGEGAYLKFNTLQDTNQINVSGSSFLPESLALWPGTNRMRRITWTNAAISVLSFARDTHDRTKQFATGAVWRRDGIRVEFDASYTDSYNDLFFSGPIFGATAAQFTHDLSTPIPATFVSGTALTDPSIYRYTGVAYRFRPFNGDLSTLTADGTYALERFGIESLATGFRHARRAATNRPGLVFGDFNFPAGAGPLATSQPALITTNRYGFFPHVATPSLRDYMSGVIDGLRDIVGYRAQLGITTPLPTSASPLTLWSIRETTDAAYLMARFRTRARPIAGNVGVRVIRTNESVSGYQGTSATNAAPIDDRADYHDVLPSLNVRYALRENLLLRLALSRTLTRPDFGQLSPSISLLPNPVDPSFNQGSAGNPKLRAIRSNNVDLALERYIGKTASVYTTVFHKHVNGFVVNTGATEVWSGERYLITRPQNANPATIEGAEVGYTQFFDFLPGVLGGLGLQANYTYIDSETPNTTLGRDTTLPNLSRHSGNIVGMFEAKRVTARVAFNWRDKFLSGQANITNVGRIPFYTRAYGWMDASFIYRWNEKLTFALEGMNLLRTKRISYFETVQHPQSAFINDRQFSFSVTLRN